MKHGNEQHEAMEKPGKMKGKKRGKKMMDTGKGKKKKALKKKAGGC